MEPKRNQGRTIVTTPFLAREEDGAAMRDQGRSRWPENSDATLPTAREAAGPAGPREEARAEAAPPRRILAAELPVERPWMGHVSGGGFGMNRQETTAAAAAAMDDIVAGSGMGKKETVGHGWTNDQ